jgi:dihydroorotase
MHDLLIKNAKIVNDGRIFTGSVLIDQQKIVSVTENSTEAKATQVIDASGLYLLPGVIDDQVHFRQPGLTYKADIHSESKAAAAGGVTSFMDMPNTKPQTITQQLLKEKFALAAENSLINYSFYIGATNDNLEELLKTDPATVCGIKLFMGASTGNMLVDNQESLKNIFSNVPMLIAIHSEYEPLIRENLAKYKEEFGESIPIKYHPIIRSEEACYRSTYIAVDLAAKYSTRLHVLHLSTARELEFFEPACDLRNKRLTNEVCVHHLWFTDKDYEKLGSLIKWNPAIKTKSDRNALLNGVIDDRIDIIATDHAPHTLEEKSNDYLLCPSGGPLIQHSLPAMLELSYRGLISLEKVVSKMCHSPAEIFQISKRGYIRNDYWADLVLVDINDPWTVEKNNILYKCGWSPFEGTTFSSRIITTIVNGNVVYDKGNFTEKKSGLALSFER